MTNLRYDSPNHTENLPPVYFGDFFVLINYNYNKQIIMKKVLLTLAVIFGTLSLMAQVSVPTERFENQNVRGRVLHNQFSDYTHFRQDQFKFEKPQIEKKDGKVIITMSEEQFNRMNQMRMGQSFGRPGFGRPGFQHVNFRRPQICEKCKRKLKSHKSKNFRKD